MKRQNTAKFRMAVLTLSAALALPGWFALTAIAATNTQTQPDPAPPAPANGPAVAPPPPPPPGTIPAAFNGRPVGPTAEVEKLAGAGVSEDVIKAYVTHAPSAFNLTPDAIIHLHEIGVSGGVITEMLNHDQTLQNNPPMPPAPVAPQPQTMAPPAQYPGATQPEYGATTDNTDYYSQLAPYGNWSYQDGYGWGWQPYASLGYNYYPWGVLGYGGWYYWPSRGWCWYPRGRGWYGGYGYRGGYGYGHGYYSGRGGVHFGGGYSPHIGGGIGHTGGGHFGGGFGGGHGGGSIGGGGHVGGGGGGGSHGGGGGGGHR